MSHCMEGNGQARAIIVIPSVEGGHLLERMLPTLRVMPGSVVVLDQGSMDNTAQVCQAAGVEVLQLGQPHTYTQACNIGARLARERGYPFLCVANNDIVFRTDVVAELLAEMDRDSKLGVVAPSQVILDPVNDVDVLACRVSWNLDAVEFLHDCNQAPAPPRLEADFCEFTCALIRMSAVAQIGFLDDAYGFYHEDADFGFRLRKAEYSAAYLPRSQIHHFTSSTFSRKRQKQVDYLRRNRIYFARKHLGYGLRQLENGSWTGEAGTFARRLCPELHRFGMIDENRPSLTAGRIGPMTSGYLVVTHRSATLSKWESGLRDKYQAVLATSDAVVTGLRSAGFTSFRVPLGIDPDIFNPWGSGAAKSRPFDETTYLAIADPFDRGPLARLLHVWGRFAAPGRRARLIVTGSRISQIMGRSADTAYRCGRVEISCYAAERIELRETAAPLNDHELAALYRSVDFTIIPQASGSNLTLAESLACGTPVVFDTTCAEVVSLYRDVTSGSATAPLDSGEFRQIDDMAGAGDGLLAAIERSERLSAGERAAFAAAGQYGVLGHSTLRHTAMAVRQALEMTQEREPGRFLQQLEAQAVAAEAAAEPPPQPSWLPDAKAVRVRLSRALALQLTTAGARAMRFGETWQRRGLPAAASHAIAYMRPATRHEAASPAGTEARSSKTPKEHTPLLIGYIDAQLGVGQSLRGLAKAIAANGMPFSIYPFGVGVEGRRSCPVMPERYDEATPHDINVIEVTPTELPRVFGNISEDHFDGSYNILRTYWELAKGPAVWRHGYGMERIDEIWAPNEFCAVAFRDFFDGPIVIVPPCLEIGNPSSGTTRDGKERFGLDPDTFYFMFSFDYYSFPERKNPLATIRAFLTAFADRRHPVGLVVKATSAENHFPAVKKAIIAAAEADGRIIIIDASLPRKDMLSLMASIDCYVSLHRSEGFGLGMAEAMAMAKPVIATDYSGNSEFVTAQTGYPIPFKLKPVRQHEYVHTEGQVWADPDEDACAEAMRAVVKHPDEAASRARAGCALVHQRYGIANVGRVAAERLKAIMLSRASPSRVVAPQRQ